MGAIKKVNVFVCPSCGRAHGEENEALECCKPAEVALFTCGACGRSHDTVDAARRCCFVIIRRPRWRCEECRSLHEGPDEASVCCN